MKHMSVANPEKEGPAEALKEKTPVVALVERNGRVRSKPVQRVNGRTLKTAIRENVHRDSRIMTDDSVPTEVSQRIQGWPSGCQPQEERILTG